jgi:hypothetical protein
MLPMFDDDEATLRNARDVRLGLSGEVMLKRKDSSNALAPSEPPLL